VGFFIEGAFMERTISFIDGFNLYHAVHRLRKNHLKWVDLWALSECFVSTRSQKLEEVLYFSAYAHWIPGAVSRHRAYVAALRVMGVSVVMGKFKEKDRACPKCSHRWKGHEEKETDVNIALALLNLARLDQFDRAMVFSRDSDLAPAIRMVRQSFPNKRITVVAPPLQGHSSELIAAASDKAKITIQQMERCLLPPIVNDPGGNLVARRPAKYDPP
jgi:uncharacterized LabA/DUF88 family protein